MMWIGHLPHWTIAERIRVWSSSSDNGILVFLIGIWLCKETPLACPLLASSSLKDHVWAATGALQIDLYPLFLQLCDVSNWTDFVAQFSDSATTCVFNVHISSIYFSKYRCWIKDGKFERVRAWIACFSDPRCPKWVFSLLNSGIRGDGWWFYLIHTLHNIVVITHKCVYPVHSGCHVGRRTNVLGDEDVFDALTWRVNGMCKSTNNKDIE